jgi:hypothetical protein
MFAWINRLDQVVPVRYGAWLLCGLGLVLSALAWCCSACAT